MQTINIKLDDDLIEEKLLKISSEKNRSINDLVLDLLYNYFSEKNNDRILFYKKLDPEKHRFKPVFPELDDNIIPTNPFLVYDIDLYTYNLKDYNSIDSLKLYKS